MPTLSTVLLTIKGEARKANITLNDDNEITVEILQKYFKKKELPEQVAAYEYDNKILFIFGYQKGKKGTENKTELPAPYSETILFGDAIVLVSIDRKWNSPIPFTVDSWNLFLNGQNEEEEDEEDDDDEEDEVEEEEEEVEDEFDEDDNIDGESEKGSIIEEDEEVEETPVPVKRRRAPVFNKVDPNAVKEEIDINSEPETNKLRTLCLSNLKFLESRFSETDIRSLEKGIFEAAFHYAQNNYIPRSWKSLQFQESYRQIVMSVFSNLHPQSPVKNTRLLSRVIDGEFTLSAIPSMTSYEMFPENWFALKDKLLQREQKILEGNKSRATDQFKCRRCQKRECTYYELQTRSADEPMTIFITCLNCGKEWRQGG
jgi:DNA-directed RNA polymerase subunit M/transcription elongation factor TFIIS